MKNNVLTPSLADAMVRVTELAAISASKEVGRGDEKKADAAAVDAMRSAFNEVEFKGRVVFLSDYNTNIARHLVRGA